MHWSENLTVERPTYVSHLECSATGHTLEAGAVHGLSPAGKPILVRYDIDRIQVSRDEVESRPSDMWKYRELLPVESTANIVSLGESATPLIEITGRSTSPPLVKDEGRLPTGSFKARGLAMAVSMAKQLGLKRLAMPTNGNAGAALAAYGSRAGMETYVLCPADTPEINVREIALQGAKVWRVDGYIDDCGKLIAEGKQEMGWFDVSTLKEPYRIEGKKTMGLELAEQLSWDLPDIIFYPTGGGTGLIGMWKAFEELGQLGWIGEKRPRMVAVQASGCAPIVKAFDDGTDSAPRWENAATIASGIRVPAAVGDFLILRAVRESGGFAIAVDDTAIETARLEVARDDGVLLCPEGAATVAAWQRSLDQGLIDPDDRVVLFNCGNGLKYPMPPMDRILERPVDWATLGM